jgi:glutathione synthase/RimK-type ligase-like ATP-grasp enzyme
MTTNGNNGTNGTNITKDANATNNKSAKPIAIYHEHPDWFRPLFTELDRRGTHYVRLEAQTHNYDAGDNKNKYSLVFNRMSPSAWLRGNGDQIFYTLSFLKHLEDSGTRVVNGHRAFLYETSKASQLSLLESLGLPYPKARVIHRGEQAAAAADGLRFPVVVKPNIGGSGAGVTKFETIEALEEASKNGSLNLGIDHIGLVQEYIPARGGFITRVEVVGGKYIYAIRVFLSGEGYNLCPADICQTTDGKELERAACPVNAAKSGLKVEGYTPEPHVIYAVERIMQNAGIEVGGVEYVIDDCDGKLYYYDINALSNFVADATRVVGLDPHAILADYLEQEARR